MNIRNLLSNLVAQICENNFSKANETLDKVVTEKVKARVEKMVGKNGKGKGNESEKLTAQQRERLKNLNKDKKNGKKCECKGK